MGETEQQQNPKEIEIKILMFFCLSIIFLSKWKTLIHSIWISNGEVIELLVLQAIKETSWKNFFFTSNVNIFQSIWSKITNLLPCDLRSV